ncbi:MAG: hypothetical protein ACK526_02705 [Planctomyces sp.]|jgi:hypothetical protein
MSNENPYAASESVSGGFSKSHAIMDPRQFYVDGEYVQCGKKVELPACCVVTGSTDDIVELRKTLTIVPRWVYVFFFFGGLLPLLAYLITRKQCKVSYSLSRPLRNRLRYRTAGAMFSLLFMIGGIVLGISTADDLNSVISVAGLISAVVFLILFLVLVYLASAPVSIARHQKGQLFWLKGFQPPFFDQLRLLFPASESRSVI